MRKLLAGMLLLTSIYGSAWAQSDSPAKQQVKQAVTHTDTTTTVAKPATAQVVTKPQKTDTTAVKAITVVAPHKIASDGITTLLVLIPVLIFFAVFLVFRKEMAQIKLADALSENTTSKVTVKNDQYKIDEIRALIEKLSGGGSTNTATSSEQERTDAYNAVLKAAQERTAAEASLSTAKTAAAADSANKALQDAVTSAQRSLDTKKTAEQDALKRFAEKNQQGAGGSISATMLMNLATLFPPTIDVSGGIDHTANTSEDKRKYRPSSSRIIAFMAGILTLVLALSMTCFFIFFYCTTGESPDLSKLFAVIVALGLGMAPYAVNKISGIVGNQNSDS